MLTEHPVCKASSPIFYIQQNLQCQVLATEESLLDSRQANGKKGNIVTPSLPKLWRRMATAVVQLHSVLTWALEGDDWLTSRSGRFCPRKDPGTHWLGGWMGAEPVWRFWKKRIISCPCQDSSPEPPSPTKPTFRQRQETSVFSKAPRMVLRPTQHHAHWFPEALFRVVKVAGARNWPTILLHLVFLINKGVMTQKDHHTDTVTAGGNLISVKWWGNNVATGRFACVRACSLGSEFDEGLELGSTATMLFHGIWWIIDV